MLVVFFLLQCLGTTSALVEPIPLPSSLEECINFKVELNKGKGVPLHVIQNMCLGKFISFEAPHSWVKNISHEEQNYVKSLFRKIISESESKNGGHRFKRGALFQPRVRREIRAAPFKHWEDYKKAVRRLKYNEIGPSGRSRYDTIADIHMTAINSSHFGPNFLPWHRLYLLVFETALGVPVPYWDSTLDYEMTNPTKSILWTAKYFGNGFGKVKTGPFAYFKTPAGPLIRNIGSDGSLFNKRELQLIFTKSLLGKISEPFADERVSIEGQHNSVHNWIDGQMNTQEFSSHDPVFWTHHSFVDFFWEKFRIAQRSRGINPELDNPHPPENVTFQSVSDPAVGLMGFYNKDGYSERIASLIKWDHPPECPKCGESPDLVCDHRKGICVSVLRDLREYEGNREDAQEIADRMIEAATGRRRRVFSQYNTDDRVRGDSMTMKKKQKLAQSLPVEMIYGPLKLESIRHYPIYNPQPAYYFPRSFYQPKIIPRGPLLSPKFTAYPSYSVDMGTRFQFHYPRRKRSIHIWKPTLENTFFVDGKIDKESWAYVPVKVIYNRKQITAIESGTFKTEFQQLLDEKQVSCLMNTEQPMKVFVQSHGLNYFGRYKDVIHSNVVESDTSYVAVKKPQKKAVETFLSAYDSCGNTCSTKCIVKGIYPPTYESCTGAVSISKNKPVMYSNVVSTSQNDQLIIPIVFTCDV